ncbi:hypothetical protein B0H14DRAFT_3435551 [Mycena olivaceomarginata]|nr:hypothetical protein B0H14DRAFT_3435551 [Mycena olivaceomarginata]
MSPSVREVDLRATGSRVPENFMSIDRMALRSCTAYYVSAPASLRRCGSPAAWEVYRVDVDADPGTYATGEACAEVAQNVEPTRAIFREMHGGLELLEAYAGTIASSREAPPPAFSLQVRPPGSTRARVATLTHRNLASLRAQARPARAQPQLAAAALAAAEAQPRVQPQPLVCRPVPRVQYPFLSRISSRRPLPPITQKR